MSGRRTVNLMLKEARLTLGYAQADVAGRAGLSRTSVTNIESGRQGVTMENLFAIAQAMGLGVSITLTNKAGITVTKL